MSEDLVADGKKPVIKNDFLRRNYPKIDVLHFKCKGIYIYVNI